LGLRQHQPVDRRERTKYQPLVKKDVNIHLFIVVGVGDSSLGYRRIMTYANQGPEQQAASTFPTALATIKYDP
jgi:hypothetical protein